MKTTAIASQPSAGHAPLFPKGVGQEAATTDTGPQFLSTAEAARKLGLSTTLIQTLVDNDELKGWKTRGGHRRIAIQSVMDYQNQSGRKNTQGHRALSSPRIMVVIENQDLMAAMQKHYRQWSFPVEVNFLDSVTEALLCFSAQVPDQLVAELNMPRPQQEKTIQALLNFNAREKTGMSMVLVTQEKNLSTSTSRITDAMVQIVPGPLTPTWFHAYLTGVATTCRW